MRIVIKYLLFFLLLAVVVPSCELLEDCKTCRMVTDDGVSETRGSGILYCGEELKRKENSNPTTEGDVTIIWECD